MRISIALVAVLACGPGQREDSPAIDAAEPCVGIACQIVDCAKKGLPDTSISGTVFAPNGTLALYGVRVYVPLLDPGPFTDGVTCTRCDPEPAGGAAASVISGADGTFFMKKAPSGTEVPLVITIGKWRKKIVIPNVDQCTDNPIPAALTALPKNQLEGEIPRIAISTGACDALECLVKKLGIDEAEFTPPTGTGAIHLYTNGGASKLADATTFPPSRDLWGSAEALARYDVILNSCECSQNADTAGNEKTQAMMDNMKAYADAGGRLFLSHYHNVWLTGAAAAGANPVRAPQQWPTIATCDPIGGVPAGNVAVIDQESNPKGPAFAAWMKAVGGSSTNGLLTISEQKKTCEALDGSKAERWLYMQNTNELQTFQFTTPNEAIIDDRCGKVVFSDMHVASGSTSSPTTPFPVGCSAGQLTPQEKALAFMLFDISSCVGEIQ